MRKKTTCKDIRTIQLEYETAFMNNGFESRNVGVMMGIYKTFFAFIPSNCVTNEKIEDLPRHQNDTIISRHIPYK